MPRSCKPMVTRKHEDDVLDTKKWMDGKFDPREALVDEMNKELGSFTEDRRSMGEISKRLHRKLTKLARPATRPVPPRGGDRQTPAPDIAKLIAEGYDPVHAAYIFVHHITSVFSENVSRFPEMRTYAKEVGGAEEEYMPSGPPMSPLTTSYFTCWAFFDHRIGTTTDTLAGCLIEANDTICMNPHQLEALKMMSQSRMGIYEHQGWRATTSGCGN